MPIRKTDHSKTQRFVDGTDWIEFRTQLSAGDEDFINDRTAASYQVDENGTVIEVEMHPNRALGALFAALVVSWSEGDGRPTVRDYNELTPESRKWVDQCVTEALSTVKKRAEKKDPSKGRRKSSRGSSRPRAAASSGTP